MAGSSTRTVKPSIIVIHTGEGILNRNDMAAFLNRSPNSSAHAASDADGVVAPLVSYDRAAWTAGYTANNRGVQIEMCAFALMTREQWLSNQDVVVWIPWLNANRTIRRPYSMLVNTAVWARSVADQYGIPKVKLNSDALKAGRAGICGHADVSAAWRETDHTDPGAGFPWDVFINLVNGGDEVSSQDVTDALFGTRVENKNIFDWFKQSGWDQDARIDRVITSLNSLAALIAKNNDVDEVAIANALVPALVVALPEQLGQFNNEQVQKIAEAVNDELARRQAE